MAGKEHVTLDVIGYVLALCASLGLFILLWWIGEATKLWWLLGKIRARWQAGMDRYYESLPPAGTCQAGGCQNEAARGGLCTVHTLLMRGDL